MKRTRNGILIPDVPIMAGGNLPNAVKGVSAGGVNWKKHAVDMGLPSGTLWADCDIDVNMPDGFCTTPFIYQKSFFSWGNVQGYNPIANSFENVYNWGSVNNAEPWYEGQPYGNTKGNTLTGDIPVDAEYDAARANLGEPWRMPSRAQYLELFANVDYLNADETIKDASATNKLSTVNGIVGLWIQSKINGARLFLAASGLGENSIWRGHGIYGDYWSRGISSTRNAVCLGFSAGGVFPNYTPDPRHFGYAVRPVMSLTA